MRNPAVIEEVGIGAQRSMWVLYGDPQWRDPLMIHRWGYSPASLVKLLVGAGFVDVHMDRARFKMREPRDMRVVATKPPTDR